MRTLLKNSLSVISAAAALSLCSPGTARAEGLEIDRIEVATSMLGDPVAEIRPGEAAVIRFSCRGAGSDDQGHLRLETGIVVRDAKGKVIVDQPRGPGVQAPDLFKSDRVPAFFMVPPHLLPGPGSYRITLLARDLSQQPAVSASAELTLTVAKAGFSLVNPRRCLDPQGSFESRGPYVVGQALFLCQNAAGFARVGGNIDMSVDVEVRSRSGLVLGVQKPVDRLQGPVEANVPAFPINVILNLSKAGRFKVTVTVTDLVSKEQRSVTHEVEVEEQSQTTKPSRLPKPSFGR